MTHVLTDLEIDEVSLVRRGADQDAHIVLYKSQGDASAPEETPHMALNPAIAATLDGVDLTDEQIASLNAAFEQRAETAPSGDGDVNGEPAGEPETGEESQAAAPEDGEGEGAVGKSEEVDKAAEDLRKRLEATEAELAKMRADVEKRDLTETVRKALPSLAFDAEDTSTLLFKLAPSDREGVLDLLKRADAAVREAGTFREQGTTVDGDESDPFGQVVAKVMAENPGMSRPTAVTKALETPEGRAAYVAKRSS